MSVINQVRFRYKIDSHVFLCKHPFALENAFEIGNEFYEECHMKVPLTELYCEVHIAKVRSHTIPVRFFRLMKE